MRQHGAARLDRRNRCPARAAPGQRHHGRGRVSATCSTAVPIFPGPADRTPGRSTRRSTPPSRGAGPGSPVSALCKAVPRWSVALARSRCAMDSAFSSASPQRCRRALRLERPIWAMFGLVRLYRCVWGSGSGTGVTSVVGAPCGFPRDPGGLWSSTEARCRFSHREPLSGRCCTETYEEETIREKASKQTYGVRGCPDSSDFR